MRTIKFRGKVKKTRAEISIGKKPDDGTWVVGDLHYYNTGIPHIHYDMAHRISVDVETIGQHTGMHDINGKDIWEGDIIESTCIKANQNLGKKCVAMLYMTMLPLRSVYIIPTADMEGHFFQTTMTEYLKLSETSMTTQNY
ncbi:MAG: hypothetical protein IJ640_07575 [Prevotella sp.]|nr:hypothetical protein [Prevotella sp.]